MKKKIIITSIIVTLMALTAFIYSYFVADYFEMWFSYNSYITMNRLGTVRFSSEAIETPPKRYKHDWESIYDIRLRHNSETVIVKKLSKEQRGIVKEILSTIDLKRGMKMPNTSDPQVYVYSILARIDDNYYRTFYLGNNERLKRKEGFVGFFGFFGKMFDIDANKYVTP